MATSPKSVRHLLKDKPTLKRLEHGISSRRTLLGEGLAHLPREVAPHCLAAQIEGTRLTLHSDSPAWATRLRYFSNQLRSLLEPTHPDLREIRIKVLLTRASGRPAPKRKPYKSAHAAEVIESSAGATAPGPLREALLRLSRAVKP
jgi:hypothetical protein